MYSLLFLLFLAHWGGDYTHLSTKSMLDAKRFGTPLLPILAHAWVHAMLTFTAVSLYSTLKVGLHAGMFMLVTHFLIDLLKGKLNILFPSLQNPANKYHWYVFGADQTLHAWVIITIVYLVNNTHLWLD